MKVVSTNCDFLCQTNLLEETKNHCRPVVHYYTLNEIRNQKVHSDEVNSMTSAPEQENLDEFQSPSCSLSFTKT